MALAPTHPLYLTSIQRWLRVCIWLVITMVALGGVTRLTESGLSIVEWKLLSGTLPPLSAQAWAEEFAQYQTSPQFQKVNSYFTLADFKQIFWLEYLHRLLGRVIGIVIVGGTVWYGARRRMNAPLLRRMLAISLLVGAQGTVGWIMVASGLEEAPRVAPIKLALHLLLALSLLMALLWTRWQLRLSTREPVPAHIAYASRFVLFITLIQIGFGALVAGLRAGLSYNTYPLMDGQWVPDGLQLLTPWWKNHLENVLTVQFQHRMGAIVVVLVVLLLARILHRFAMTRILASTLIALVILQFSLGVATLLSGVNLWLASAHQLVAVFLLIAIWRAVYLTPLDANQRVG